MRDLNTFYRSEPALYELDSDPAGFEWIDCSDNQRSIVSFVRRGKNRQRHTVFVCNFTPVPRHNYRVGVPAPGWWDELVNTDAVALGGSGQGNLGGVEAAPVPAQGHPLSINLVLPPLAALFLRRRPAPRAG